jgi:hypothetical protein
MKPTKGYYTIDIPTKPYLKKYLQSLYGDPLTFSRDDYFGSTLTGYLQRKFYSQNEKELTYRKFDTFSTTLTVHMPAWWLTESHFGTDIPEDNIIFLNKHFENLFEEKLVTFTMSLGMANVNVKTALELFCKMHNIEIDVDITYDALKQKHYRGRKKSKKLYCVSVTPKVQFQTPAVVHQTVFETYNISSSPLSFSKPST